MHSKSVHYAVVLIVICFVTVVIGCGKPSSKAEKCHIRGMIYLENHKYNDAIKEFKKALKFKPNRLDTHYQLGRAYSHLKKYDNALLEYKEVIKLKPGFFDAIEQICGIYSEQKKFDEAVQFCADFIEKNQNSENAYYLMATIYLGKAKSHIEEKIFDIDTELVKKCQNKAIDYLEKAIQITIIS